MTSNDRFGYEWHKYSRIDPNYELQFRNWIRPLTPADFKDKIILDSGCGMGRNSYWPLLWGAKEVVAFDYDQRSVQAAKKNLARFDNAEVLFKSIYEIDWQKKFDLVLSIGVIHHLKDPQMALEKLVRSLRPGGTLLVWVYSYEGSEWIVKYINPIRKNLTSKLPVGLVHALSYFLSAPLWSFVRIVRGPGDYLKQISNFKFWHVHSIVFDQLIPEVANYWNQDEVRRLFAGIGLKDFSIHRPENRSGWTIVGRA